MAHGPFRRRGLVPCGLLIGLALVQLGFIAYAVVVEWTDVVAEAGSRGAAGDAASRLVTGIVLAAIETTPALVALERRHAHGWRGPRGLVAGALIAAAAALLGVAGWLFFTTDSSTAALVFIYPLLLCPLLALGVALAVPR